MGRVERITDDEAEARLGYLQWVAGCDLAAEVDATGATDDHNPAKVIETLRIIAKAARECALYLEEVNL